MMTKLILGPLVGGLADTQAYLWARADGPATLHAWLGQQPDLSDAALAGTFELPAENGFAGIAPLNDLIPETQYFYTLTLDASPPAPTAEAYPAFTTFPVDGEIRSFSFAFGSCFLPQHENGGEIFNHLNQLRLCKLLHKDLYFPVWLGSP